MLTPTQFPLAISDKLLAFASALVVAGVLMTIAIVPASPAIASTPIDPTLKAAELRPDMDIGDVRICENPSTDVLDLRPRTALGADLVSAFCAPLGALLEHHLQRDQEQHHAAGDAERVDADIHRGDEPRAADREQGSQKDPGHRQR